MSKVILVIFSLICLNMIGNNGCLSKTQEGSSRISDDKYSGLYKGIYFFEDDGAIEKVDISPIILINDTCSYILFSGVLEKFVSIDNNIVTFGNAISPCKICIGEGIVIDDGDYGEVKVKSGETVNGLIKKSSSITEIEMNNINDAVKEESEFLVFWKTFTGALSSGDAELLSGFVRYPFEDVYGRYYPKIVSKGVFDISTRSEFMRQYNNIFTTNVKEYLGNNLPVKQYRYEVYYIDVPGFRPFNFEKINGVWMLTKFPYEI